MSKRKLLATVVLLVSLFLTACQSTVPTNPQTQVTLPPPEDRFTAPDGSAEQEYAETVQLSVPALSGGQLIMVPERILLSPNQHPAEATLRKLLSFTGNDRAAQLYPGLQLQLQAGSTVEISGDVATVNLGANASMLNKQDLLTLSRAITNTLTQWGDLHYVNILIAGAAPAMDERGMLPLGSMQLSRNEDAPALWDSYAARSRMENPQSQRFSALCTLYYPAPAGRGVLAEARAVSFAGQDTRQMTVSLLEALSARAQTLPRAPQVPDLMALLAAAPEIREGDDGSQVIGLHFLDIANQTFIEAGIPRSVMLASLCYTLTTFMPDLDGIAVRIGNEQLEAIVPSGIYQGAGEQIIFSGGVLRRANFASFLLTDCTLYFARGDSLLRVRRPVPHQYAFSKRYLMDQLLEGPQQYDSVQETQPVLPDTLHAQDLLGVSKDGDAALINLSQAVVTASAGLTAPQERLMVYAITNTLCESRGIRRVRFYVDGEQTEKLSGHLWLAGEFLFNPNIVAP